MPTARFAGFPEEGIRFLRSLEKNNNREWFQARKEIYETSVKAPMVDLVEAINAALADFAPDYITDPKKAIYRIYRDTRFSKNKAPYKTTTAASFWRQGMEKHISAGYYFGITPRSVEIAGGIYMPGPNELRTIRDHVAERHEELRTILNQPPVRKLMGNLHGEPLSRVPKGYAQDHPAADLLRNKMFILYVTDLDPGLAGKSSVVNEIAKRFRVMVPFLEFMNQPLLNRKKDPLTVCV